MNGDGTASGTLAREAAPVGVRWGAVELARALGQSHAPTPEQVAVIEAPLRPLLVVAGAGSGKTETMAARVVWLVANELGASPTRCSGSPSPARRPESCPSGSRPGWPP